MKTALQVIGAVIEGIGLLIAGLALAHTWHVNADQRKFWPSVLTQAREVWNWMRGKPQRITGHLNVVLPAITVNPGTVIQGFPPTATVEERISQLKAEVDQINVVANEGNALAHRVEEKQQKDDQEVRQQVGRLREETAEKMKDNTVEGLPLAGLGLMLTGLGLTLQAAGDVWPQSG